MHWNQFIVICAAITIFVILLNWAGLKFQLLPSKVFEIVVTVTTAITAIGLALKFFKW